MTGALKPCGSYAAYKRHLRHYQDPCPACKAANAAATAAGRRALDRILHRTRGGA